MSSQYYTIKADGSYEISIKKSRFLCSLFRIETEEQAKQIIKEIRKEHNKANHHCFSYVLGKNQAIQRSSDDGEPSGTAGVPMLDVLKAKDFSNVLAVVTRYFGGTKLGSGGLIRAYSHSVSETIAQIGIVKGIRQQEIMVSLDYSLHGKLTHFLEKHPEYLLKETFFTEKVLLNIMVNLNEQDFFIKQVRDLLSDNCDIQLGEIAYIEVPI